MALMQEESRDLYIGLISGTSMDAVDCALVDFSGPLPRLIDFLDKPLPGDLKQRLLALCWPGQDTVQALGEADIALGRLFADAVLELLARCKLAPSAISAIGSHGQTVRHQPPAPGIRPDVQDPAAPHQPFTLQIGDPNLISELTGITTVADFRRRDLAAGGQGAPLVPVFHREIFSLPGRTRIVLNIGGMANITILDGKSGRTPAYDTGPGNVLLDYWAGEHLDRPFDDNGDWGAGGQPVPALLQALLNEPYFRQPPPKSTGRELFNPAWLRGKLEAFPGLAARDVQATLAAFTAASISRDILREAPEGEVIVCGGGARNGALLERLRAELPGFTVAPSDDYGLTGDSVEAVAFAWFARKALARETVDMREITGANRPMVLGGVYYV